MRRFAIVVAACSSSSQPTSLPTTPPPPLQVADTADEDPPEPESDGRYRFEWQALRDEYAAFLSTPIDTESCDIRSKAFPQSRSCRGPHQMAGRVAGTGGSNKPGFASIEIDRGARDRITADWTVALLDDEGHPVTPWATVGLVGDRRCFADVEIHPVAAAKYLRAGMRIDQRLLDRRAEERWRRR